MPPPSKSGAGQKPLEKQCFRANTPQRQKHRNPPFPRVYSNIPYFRTPQTGQCNRKRKTNASKGHKSQPPNRQFWKKNTYPTKHKEYAHSLEAIVNVARNWLRAPDAPQNVRFCRNQRKWISRKWEKELGKVSILHVPKLNEGGQIRTKVKKSNPLFSALRFFVRTDSDDYLEISAHSRKLKNLQKKRTDKSRGISVFPPFQFLDKDLTPCRFWWVGGHQEIDLDRF